MKIARIVSLAVVFQLACNSAPARAENFVEQFLNRYRPAKVDFSTPPAVQGQELENLIRTGQLQLTIGDVVNLMLENNLDIGANRLTPRSSEYLIETLYGVFEPTLRLQATVNRNTTPSTSVLAGSASGINLLSGQYLIGFSQTLETGTNVAVDFNVSRTSSNNGFNTFNPAYNGTIRYSFNQHLLRDFGRLNNTRPIRIARNNEKISESQFERQVIDLVSQGQRTYWDLVFAAEDIKVKQRSKDLAQKTLGDNKIQVDIGTLAPIDLVQAESEVATRNEQLVVSTYTQVQTEDQVKKLITLQADPGLVVARVTPVTSVRRPSQSDVLPVTEAIKVALENRPEMKQLQLDLENKNIDVQYTKNQLLPTVDLIGSYTQNGVGGTKTVRAGFFDPNAPIISTTTGGLGDTLAQLFGYNYTGYAVGISAQIPLRNRAARGDNARAVTEKRIAENRINAQAQQIALEVRNALTQVDMNKARIETAEKARELAERRLEAEQKKFDLGASTIRFVLEEQRNVAEAQTNELQALVNYTKALVDTDRAMGMTLKKNNIEIEKTLRSAN